MSGIWARANDFYGHCETSIEIYKGQTSMLGPSGFLLPLDFRILLREGPG